MSITTVERTLKQQVDETNALTRDLVTKHKSEWEARGKRLLSAILFGALAADEWSEEIWLLEIVKGYPYPRKGPVPASTNFKSTRDFPMFGHLRLWVWSPEEFNDAVGTNHPFIEQLREEPKKYLVDLNHLAKKSLG